MPPLIDHAGERRAPHDQIAPAPPPQRGYDSYRPSDSRSAPKYRKGSGSSNESAKNIANASLIPSDPRTAGRSRNIQAAPADRIHSAFTHCLENHLEICQMLSQKKQIESLLERYKSDLVLMHRSSEDLERAMLENQDVADSRREMQRCLLKLEDSYTERKGAVSSFADAILDVMRSESEGGKANEKQRSHDKQADEQMKNILDRLGQLETKCNALEIENRELKTDLRSISAQKEYERQSFEDLTTAFKTHSQQVWADLNYYTEVAKQLRDAAIPQLRRELGETVELSKRSCQISEHNMQNFSAARKSTQEVRPQAVHALSTDQQRIGSAEPSTLPPDPPPSRIPAQHSLPPQIRPQNVLPSQVSQLMRPSTAPESGVGTQPTKPTYGAEQAEEGYQLPGIAVTIPQQENGKAISELAEKLRSQLARARQLVDELPATMDKIYVNNARVQAHILSLKLGAIDQTDKVSQPHTSKCEEKTALLGDIKHLNYQLKREHVKHIASKQREHLVGILEMKTKLEAAEGQLSLLRKYDHLLVNNNHLALVEQVKELQSSVNELGSHDSGRKQQKDYDHVEPTEQLYRKEFESKIAATKGYINEEINKFGKSLLDNKRNFEGRLVVVENTLEGKDLSKIEADLGSTRTTTDWMADKVGEFGRDLAGVKAAVNIQRRKRRLSDYIGDDPGNAVMPHERRTPKKLSR